jgi:hypothetical protein
MTEGNLRERAIAGKWTGQRPWDVTPLPWPLTAPSWSLEKRGTSVHVDSTNQNGLLSTVQYVL